MPDSPDTCRRKPYPERKSCRLKNIWIRVDEALMRFSLILIFHELKTKGFDVIGVNVFQEHFHLVVVQLRQRNVQKTNSGANTTALPNTKLKLPYGAPKR